MKKKLLSGVKPTGSVHIGNYFGAMKQFVDLSNEYDCFFMIADYHALNSVNDKEKMKSLIFDLVCDYLAIGIDPKNAVIFQQSKVSAHTELAWIFETLTTMPYLMRAHAFKDAEAKNKEINVGTFNYPMLMAADILLYDADVVPVGQDQKQHIEITRDTALKFNNTYDAIFNLPEAKIMEDVAVVPGVDGRKMSKSYNNTIPLFASREEIIKCVMGIVTDSSGGRPVNVYNMHRLFRDEEYLEKLYKEHEGKYKALKEALIEDLDAFIAPLREKREYFASNRELVLSIIEEGSKKAGDVANKKILQVRESVGVSL